MFSKLFIALVLVLMVNVGFCSICMCQASVNDKSISEPIFPKDDVRVVKDGESTEISGSSQSSARKSVIAMCGDKLVSIKSTFDPKLVKVNPSENEMSDQQINDALTVMGKPQTKEETDKLRAIMKSARESTAKLKDTIITTTSLSVDGI